MDVLSDVLGTLHLQGTVFGSLQLSTPWGVSAGPRDQFIFHIMARGRCWFELPDRAPIEASTGDVLLLAPRRAHVLRDAADSPVRAIEEMIAAGDFGQHNRDPGATQIVCGGFRVDDTALLSALPPVIHTHELASDAGPWLSQTAKLLAYEAGGGNPGGATVASRVCDALFVYVIRSVLARLPHEEASWLRALVTPKIGEALGMIHADPSVEWSVAMLAARVGMSRSAFAERFAEVVGETPIQYLIRWRAQKAAGLLRSGDRSIAEIATAVGYQSEVAFAKAFKRAIGVAPGAYRKMQSFQRSAASWAG
jgi:AraC-like DNA-binding protein